MVEPINLNKVRKARAQADAKAEAERNRTSFGRTRAQKAAEAAARDAAARLLDGSRREPPKDD